jgi:uncharacterized protein
MSTLTFLPNMGKIIPEMGIYKGDNHFSIGLFSKTRQAVLALLYGDTDGSFYTKQILDTVKIGRGAVQRELKNLTDAGIITRQVRGREVYYQANQKCPIFNELKGIVEKKAPSSRRSFNGDELIAHRFNVPKDRLAEYCRRHHIKKLLLFGSVLRDDFRTDSDIDVLVEFEAGHVPGFAIIDMENELSKLVRHKIDLRTKGDLSRYFREQVVREARLEYTNDG